MLHGKFNFFFLFPTGTTGLISRSKFGILGAGLDCDPHQDVIRTIKKKDK